MGSGLVEEYGLMGRFSLDFGTGNSVLARFSETLQQAVTFDIPGISTRIRYRVTEQDTERQVFLVPSLIHYGESQTLIGDQVVSRGLSDHPDTFRWMKRSIMQGSGKRRKTAQGFRSASDAGGDFLRLLLHYASEHVDPASDEVTLTAPVEAFEKYTDWLGSVAEAAGIQRLRIIDEPTACVLGYLGGARRTDRFAVVDFGCGTLDTSVVRVDLNNMSERKAVQLGMAGVDLGGMDLDQWLADDFCQRNCLPESISSELMPLLLLEAEQVKISLSDPQTSEADMTVLFSTGSATKLLQASYRRRCSACERGGYQESKANVPGCLGCLLMQHQLTKRVREVLDRAVENASVKVGLRRTDITRLLVTGGTSLIPCVNELFLEVFPERTEFANPFDAVARGACCGAVTTILQHDYALQTYDARKGKPVFLPLFRAGTELPTSSDDAVRLWCNGIGDGQTRVGLKVFEGSSIRQRRLGRPGVEESGVLLPDESLSGSTQEYRCLNPDNPTFINANPPVHMKRDQNRFACRFDVDAHRRLLVTVRDQLNGQLLFSNYPVVRL